MKAWSWGTGAVIIMYAVRRQMSHRVLNLSGLDHGCGVPSRSSRHLGACVACFLGFLTNLKEEEMYLVL